MGVPSDAWVQDVRGEPARPETLEQWAESTASKRRQICLDEYDGWSLSTVFLTVDHCFMGTQPVLWETMLFPGCEYQRRYTSHEDAVAGHLWCLRQLLMGAIPLP